MAYPTVGKHRIRKPLPEPRRRTKALKGQINYPIFTMDMNTRAYEEFTLIIINKKREGLGFENGDPHFKDMVSHMPLYHVHHKKSKILFDCPSNLVNLP